VTAFQPSLFATCALPGCTSPVVTWGDVCGGCQVAFNDYLRPARPDQLVPTEHDKQRDHDVAAGYARQHDGTEADRPRRVDHGDEHEKRANQRCWLCEQRRTCTRMPHGWECENCRAIA